MPNQKLSKNVYLEQIHTAVQQVMISQTDDTIIRHMIIDKLTQNSVSFVLKISDVAV